MTTATGRVHMPMPIGQTPLCRAVGCGVWLAMDDDGQAVPGWVTCGNCLRIMRAES